MARRITGSGRVKYANRSPDTLRSIAVQLYANVYRADARRNVTVPITEGIRLTRVTAQGVELLEAKSALPATYTVDGTIGWLRLPRPLGPGATVELYDVLEDPDQYDNLADDPTYADVVAQLHDVLAKARVCRGAQCRAPLPPDLR